MTVIVGSKQGLKKLGWQQRAVCQFRVTTTVGHRSDRIHRKDCRAAGTHPQDFRWFSEAVTSARPDQYLVPMNICTIDNIIFTTHPIIVHEIKNAHS